MMTTLNFDNLSLAQAACIERALQRARRQEHANYMAKQSTQQERLDADQEIHMIDSILHKD
jgi:hypothetical protein